MIRYRFAVQSVDDRRHVVTILNPEGSVAATYTAIAQSKPRAALEARKVCARLSKTMCARGGRISFNIR